MLGIDIQQVSVASLIIALGLLVDDPVVAGDSIKRMLAEGQPRIVAAWLGPTKIATAIMYATITNIVAYLPFLMITGTTGEFSYSLPIVMTVALVASRLASMTFIPLLGYYLLRPGKKPETADRRAPQHGLHRLLCLGRPSSPSSTAGRWPSPRWPFCCSADFCSSQLKSSFFPDDVQYWSYVDVWLPNDANFDATNDAAQQVEQIIREQAEVYGKQHPRERRLARAHPELRDHLGGRRRSALLVLAIPQAKQLNYAQVLVQLTDKETHAGLRRSGAARCCRRQLPGARCDYRQLQTNPVNYPVEIRVISQADVGTAQSAQDIAEMRRIAAR